MVEGTPRWAARLGIDIHLKAIERPKEYKLESRRSIAKTIYDISVQNGLPERVLRVLEVAKKEEDKEVRKHLLNAVSRHPLVIPYTTEEIKAIVDAIISQEGIREKNILRNGLASHVDRYGLKEEERRFIEERKKEAPIDLGFVLKRAKTK